MTVQDLKGLTNERMRFSVSSDNVFIQSLPFKYADMVHVSDIGSVEMVSSEVVRISVPVRTMMGDHEILADLNTGIVSAETVVLFGRENVDSHISVKLDADKLNLKSGKATYDDIKAYVREKYGFEVHSACIGQVKEKLGIRERKNYNVGSGKYPMPLCPPEKEEAIKDALRHFGLI